MFELKRQEAQVPFRLRGGPELMATLAWPDPPQFRKLYENLEWIAASTASDEATIERDSTPRVFDFLVQQLRAVSATNGRKAGWTLEEFVNGMKQNRQYGEGVASAVIATGLLTLWLPKKKEAASDDEAEITLNELFKNTVEVVAREWRPKAEGGGYDTEDHALTFDLEPMTKLHIDRYRGAKQRSLRRGKSVVRAKPWDIFCIFRDLARSIDGASIDGVPCVEENREEWVERVPYPWIDDVLASHAGAVEGARPT